MTDELPAYAGRLVIERGQRFLVRRDGTRTDDGPVIEGDDPHDPSDKARLLNEAAVSLARSARESREPS
jgi:hypothetical protein